MCQATQPALHQELSVMAGAQSESAVVLPCQRKQRSKQSGVESLRKAKRLTVRQDRISEMQERLIMAQSEIERRRWGRCEMREMARMATADAESRCEQLRCSLKIIESRLRWHENVRDVAPSSVIAGLLNFNDGDCLPSWIVLEGRQLM